MTRMPGGRRGGPSLVTVSAASSAAVPSDPSGFMRAVASLARIVSAACHPIMVKSAIRLAQAAVSRIGTETSWGLPAGGDFDLARPALAGTIAESATL